MKKFCRLSNCFVAATFLVILFSQVASAFEIGARGYLWFPTLKSNLRDSGNSTPGTEFNLKDDLGLGSKPYPSIEVYGGLGKSHVSLMYTQAEYSGSTSLISPITFNGTPFNIGAVDSTFKITMLDLAYKYDIIDLGNILAGFSISAIGKLKYIEGETAIASGGLQSSGNFKLPVPMVGAAAHIGILANILEARAELTGIAYSGNYIYEALADLSFTPFPFVDINGGYKIIGIHVDYNDIYFASDIAGPYLALTVGF